MGCQIFKRGVSLCVSALFFSLFPLFCQEKEVPFEYDVSVQVVTLSVTVQDGDGRFVDNLSKADFRIFENNKLVTVDYFSHEFTAPLSLTVLLDVSGSMGLQDKLPESRAALRLMVQNILSPQDELALLIFADGEVEVAAPFSRERERFLKEIEHLDAFGQTALFDALAVSPEYATRGNREKRALLLITDGVENDSRMKIEDVGEIARRADVPIFVIGYKIPLTEQLLKHKRAASLTPDSIVSSLKFFAETTGGKAFYLNDSSQLYATLGAIKRELSHQYIVGFTSHNGDSQRKILRVQTKKKSHRVRTRQSYR